MATASAGTVPFGNGQLSVTTIARNAVRIQYQEGAVKQSLPEWIYVNNTPVEDADIKVDVDRQHQRVSVKDASGRVVFTATQHQFSNGKATLAFSSLATPHAGEHTDLHSHAFVKQRLWHLVEQLWSDGVQSRSTKHKTYKT